MPMSTAVIVMSLALAAVIALSVVTQYLAGVFKYDPRLGSPILTVDDRFMPLLHPLAIGVLGFAGLTWYRRERRQLVPSLLLLSALFFALARGPFYDPGRALQWWPQLSRRPEFVQVQGNARGLAVVAFFGSAAVFLLLSRPPRRKRVSNSHGTAEWGSGDQFRQPKKDLARMRRESGKGNGGLLIGRHADGSLLWYGGASHVLTMAPTRSGKGVGSVVPNLLTYPGSVLVTDVKGENYFITHRQRQESFGQTIYVLDPFEVTVQNGVRHANLARFNPLRMIETLGPRAHMARDDAQAIAEALILEGSGDNKHWSDEARTALTGFMLYICYKFDQGAEDLFPVETPYGRDLMTLRYFTTRGEEQFERILSDMAECGHAQVEQVAATMRQKDSRERSGVISSMQAQLSFLDSPAMATVLADRIHGVPNPLREADLFSIKKRGAEMTVYMVIPPSFLESHAGWLRMLIICTNNIITRTSAAPKHRILFLLDEFANLGKMEPVRRGISLVGGYGVAFWLIVQDLSQVEAVYEKGWGTMFANTDVKQLFGTNDLRTAKEVSELSGDATVYSDSGSSGASSDPTGMSRKGKNVGDSASEKGRKLLLPDEVLRMDPRAQLLLVRGSNPMLLEKLNYLEMPELQNLYDPNPMYG
jgi:type IV secretion system protein VirD4